MTFTTLDSEGGVKGPASVEYELEIPRGEFIARLGSVYQAGIEEVQSNGQSTAQQSPSPLKQAGYPPLDQLPERPDAFTEAMKVHLGTALLQTFLPAPQTPPRFQIESIDRAWGSTSTVVVRGRGRHLTRRRSLSWWKLLLILVLWVYVALVVITYFTRP